MLLRMTMRWMVGALAGGIEPALCCVAGFLSDVQERGAAAPRAGRGTFYAATVLVEVRLALVPAHTWSACGAVAAAGGRPGGCQ